MKTIKELIEHYDDLSKQRESFVIDTEEWQTIRTALFATQRCSNARIVYSYCYCNIKDTINPEMSHCDGEGEYTVTKSMGYQYAYQCNKCEGKQS